MDISIVLNKCFHAGELYWQQGDSEYASQNKRADVTYNNFCSLRDEAVEYFRAIESERDELKAKLAEIEAQEPCGYMVRGNFFHSKVVAEESCFHITSYHENSEVEPVYAKPKPPQPIANNSEPVQRITEQDAREIISSWGAFNQEVFEMWCMTAGKKVLAKLNEHREPVTPNKAEVPVYTDTDIDRRLGKVLKASGSALAHFTMHKTRHDMRVAMREAISLPPLKDGE